MSEIYKPIDIEIKYKYYDHYYSGCGEKFFGNRDEIEAVVNGQIFKETLVTIADNRITKAPTERERIEQVGKKIQEIGLMISRQAKHGKSSKVVINGMEFKTF